MAEYENRNGYNRGGYGNKNYGSNNRYGNGGRNFSPKSQNHVSPDFYNPYTFVPLADEYLSLGKEEVGDLQISHDVPFKNGFSGKIYVEFESMTQFSVLGPDASDGKKDNVNINGQYYIPGSSIKGMLRNVFEIISYSNIRNGMEADNRYSMRDLRSYDYKIKDPKNPPKTGFLVDINGKYYIYECEYARYLYEDKKNRSEDIQYICDIVDINKFKRSGVKDKYAMIQGKEFKKISATQYGMWVFSGPMANKKHEFLFQIPDFSRTMRYAIPDNTNNKRKDGKNAWGDFLFIHESENESPSWKFWKKRFKSFDSEDAITRENIIPCFFRLDEEGDVKDFGLSFLYRQPYDMTIGEFVPNSYMSDAKDIAQAVFGYVSDSPNKPSLKGRVVVGNSFLPKGTKHGAPQTFIMGAPKPSYYPFYLEQGGKELSTYFNEGAVISGFKRYLLHNSAMSGNALPSKVSSTFYPMPAHTKFSSTIYFHNLQDYELGALLCAITFCNHADSCYHSLGYAKPFGYGKLKVNKCEFVYLEANDGSDDKDLDYFYDSYMDMLNGCGISEKQFNGYLSRLFMISEAKYDSSKIRYPKSGMTSPGMASDGDKNNEFAAIKNKQNSYSIDDFTPNK